MTIRRSLIFFTVAFSLSPLVLPAQQLAVVDESANSADRASPEAAAVLELVKNLDGK